MKLKRSRQDDVEINLVSLIDVLLFLVIFFMVSTTFVKKSQLSLTLPEAATNEESDRDKAIEVTLGADGHCNINGEPLVDAKLATIEQALGKAAKGMNNPTIVINADANATHQAVVTVLDAARRLRLLSISFAIQEPDET